MRRMGGSDKFNRTRTAAAVVRSFHDIASKASRLSQKLSFYCSLNVTGQEKNALAILDPQDKGIVILDGWSSASRRPEKGQDDITELKALTGTNGVARNSPAVKRLHQPPKYRVIRSDRPMPDLANVKTVHQWDEPSNVVNVRMCRHHGVKASDTACPQTAGNDTLADVRAVFTKAVRLGAAAVRLSAAIYKDGLACWKL
jgi:hypothetical protein